jgi:hypothetical protein
MERKRWEPRTTWHLALRRTARSRRSASPPHAAVFDTHSRLSRAEIGSHVFQDSSPHSAYYSRGRVPLPRRHSAHLVEIDEGSRTFTPHNPMKRPSDYRTDVLLSSSSSMIMGAQSSYKGAKRETVTPSPSPQNSNPRRDGTRVAHRLQFPASQSNIDGWMRQVKMEFAQNGRRLDLPMHFWCVHPLFCDGFLVSRVTAPTTAAMVRPSQG